MLLLLTIAPEESLSIPSTDMYALKTMAGFLSLGFPRPAVDLDTLTADDVLLGIEVVDLRCVLKLRFRIRNSILNKKLDFE